jgi:hypothetical protein
MGKYSVKSILAGMLGLIVAVVFAVQASAMVPTLTLTNNGYGTIQVSVYGDANAPIVLDYYANGQLLGAGILGYTNYNGSFSGSINQSNYYLIPNGAQVIVMVNGQQSNMVTWQSNGSSYNPYPYNNSALTFSVTNTSLTVGQSQTVYINGSYNTGYGNQYSISSNLSNGVVQATISGNALTLYGQNAGSATITVCSNNNGYYNYNNGSNGCGTLYVTVTGNYYNNPCPVYTVYNNCGNGYQPYPYTNNAISVSNSNVQVMLGSTAAVTVYDGSNNYYDPYNNGYNNYGSGNYYVTNNGSAIASATVSGNTVSIYGMGVGYTTLNVCQTSGSCAVINVTVTSPYVYNGYNGYNSGYYNNYNNGYPPDSTGNWYWNSNQNCWQHY